MKRLTLFLAFLVLLALAGCAGGAGADGLAVEQTPLRIDTPCSGGFVARDLPHITGEIVERVSFFISNGSGLAVGDLDNDGDNDIILGNLFGPNQIFWNEGDWQFRPTTLFEGSTRAITTVDVNADGWLDVVVAARNGDVRAWYGQGDGRFELVRLPGVNAYAYSMDWADLDQDGDLDLVTASYDASMEKQSPMFRQSNRAGVALYYNEGDRFREERLAREAQALAVQVEDLNGDGLPDILVGNDFDVPDYIWLGSGGGWQAAQPFDSTTMSTMSFASGDVNNDGQMELFAADMHPYSESPEVMSQWQPVMDAMVHDMMPDDPQQMANVLQTWVGEGRYANVAGERGVAASGWSWSSQFGDLDQDGFLDLYVVNGMQALDNFSHLPNDELVEENQAYRNNRQGGFVPAPEWGLNTLYGGRSMTMADFDGDGDLDIVINNLLDPAQVFENQLCRGASLLVNVRWPGSPNTHALGATLVLHTSSGVYRRQIRAVSGYLSGNPAQAHFGFPDGSRLERLEIIWPDGEMSTIEELQPEHLLTIERNQ